MFWEAQSTPRPRVGLGAKAAIFGAAIPIARSANWYTGRATTTGTTVDIGALIYSKPELHRGQPCLAGTGMTVKAVAIHHVIWGESAEEILEGFPHLDLARIHAALAYYFANRAAIDFEMARIYGSTTNGTPRKPRGARP